MVVCNGKNGRKRGRALGAELKKKGEKMVCIMQEICKGCGSMCSDRAKREGIEGVA